MLKRRYSAFCMPCLIIDHAGGDRGFSHGVADVETFDALRDVGQAERFAQRDDAAFLRASFPSRAAPAPAARSFRAISSHGCLACRHVRPAPGHGRRLAHRIDLLAVDHQRRPRLFDVVLVQERLDHIARLRRLRRVLREEAAVADMPAGADHRQVDAGHAVLEHAGRRRRHPRRGPIRRTAAPGRATARGSGRGTSPPPRSARSAEALLHALGQQAGSRRPRALRGTVPRCARPARRPAP